MTGVTGVIGVMRERDRYSLRYGSVYSLIQHT